MYSTSFFENRRERKIIIDNSRDIIEHLSSVIGERTLVKYESLNAARDYILNYIKLYNMGAPPVLEKYTVNGREVSNISVEIKGITQPENIIILGAHYDTVEGCPGANDNASAIAAMLEIFRLFAPLEFKKTIRFVAFTLEEPPYFSSPDMGSMVYSNLCKSRKENIEMMIALDMLGWGGKNYKQVFPTEDMKKKAPAKGDYLCVLSLPSCAKSVYLWKKINNENYKHKIYDVVGPASIPGIGWSDHASFIKNGFQAVMISDTGYYRNQIYHTPEDNIDSINFDFLLRNITSLFVTLKEILNMEPLA
jgi:Zn-dependent M28 family amino/carboxypeptidase